MIEGEQKEEKGEVEKKGNKETADEIEKLTKGRRNKKQKEKKAKTKEREKTSEKRLPWVYPKSPSYKIKNAVPVNQTRAPAVLFRVMF